MYTGCLYLLIDGDKISGEVAPNKGLKQDCPLSHLLYTLYTNDIDRFLTVQRDAATALDSVQVPHCDYADDIALTSNTAECLQFQLMPMLFARCSLSGVWQLVRSLTPKYGFYPGRNFWQPMFILRHLQHAARTIKPNGSPRLHAAFIDIKQAYDTIPWDALWKHLWRTCMPAPFLSVIQECTTVMSMSWRMVIRLLVCIRLMG